MAKEGDENRQAEEQPLIRSAEDEDGDAQGKQPGVAGVAAAEEAGECTQNQRAGKADEDAGMEGVSPVAEEAEVEDGEEATEEGPGGGEPGLQHPA